MGLQVPAPHMQKKAGAGYTSKVGTSPPAGGEEAGIPVPGVGLGLGLG